MTVRVVTYNLREGTRGQEAALLRLLRGLNADVLVMQEVLDLAQAERLGAALEMRPVFAPSNARTRNLALLSRLPVTAAADYHPFPLLRTLLLARLTLPDGRPLDLFAIHLGLIHDLWRTVELHVILRRIARWRADNGPAPAIVAGDLNSVAAGERMATGHLPYWLRTIMALQFGPPFRMAPRLLGRAGFVDGFRTLHPGVDGFTFPAPRPGARLDHLFVTTDMRAALRRCEVVTTPPTGTLSDHYPLLAEVDPRAIQTPAGRQML